MRSLTTRPSALPRIAIAAIAAALAIEPVCWLVRTWVHPAYGGMGPIVFGAWALLVGTALRTPVALPNRSGTGVPWIWIGVAAGVRVLGHLLAVNLIGGLSLVIDAYVVSRVAQMDERASPRSSLALAALFALALPFERVLQRLLGYPLQWSAALGAEPWLQLWSGAPVERAGTRLRVDGFDVLVDLPCSGAQGLYLTLVAGVALAAFYRPRPWRALQALGVGLLGAWCANVFRVVAIGANALAQHRGTSVGVDLTQGVGHELVGLLTLVVAIAPIAWSLSATEERSVDDAPSSEDSRSNGSVATGSRVHGSGAVESRAMASHAVNARVTQAPPARHLSAAWSLSLLLVAALAAVSFAPRTALDVSARFDDLSLPGHLAGHAATRLPLSEAERDAFTAHGGSALRASYGPHSLLVIRTSAPLRHLHEPVECMRALGMRVERIGVVHYPIPHALYRATDAEGRAWRLAVTYLSSEGTRATSVAEVVWRWLHTPQEDWTALQRVSPWNASHVDDAAHVARGGVPVDALAFDRAVAQAWDVAFDIAPQLAPQDRTSARVAPPRSLHTPPEVD